MTVIIGSLFLPYTIQFEVGAQTEVPEPNVEVPRRKSSSAPRPVPGKQNAILPSLSRGASYQQSPGTSPGNERTVYDSETAEQFFLKKTGKAKDKKLSELFAENLDQKLLPQYIQPRSKINLHDGSVVDSKKESDDIGLPSLKISRSGTNLSSLSNLSPSPGPGSSRVMSSLNRSTLSMSLRNNSSASLLIDPIKEEEDPVKTYESEDEDTGNINHDSDDDNGWSNDFNEMNNPRAKLKLAPFGGFSNPILEKGIIDKSNVFETSPWKVLFAATGNGSLIKAIKMAVDDNMIHKRRWVGTLAMPTDEVPERVINEISKTLSDDYHSEAVLPSDLTFAGHYRSFCKQLLWPTLHYEIPDNPKSKAFEDHSWGHYKALNQLIADKIIEVYSKENGNLDPNDPENMIWIHDYHLLLVPQMIREKLPHAKVGLFLHVSFPSSEVFRCLAQRDALLKGMLGANAISFQTDEYVRHFLQTCSRLLLADANEYGLTYEGRFTMVNTIPVGINANSLSKLILNDNVTEWRERIRERWGNQRLLVSRDKIDKLRGIKEKLLAYEAFLKNNPSAIDTTVLIQICIGTSSSDDYMSQITSIVSRINSLAENISVSQPVLLLQQDIGFDQYLALQSEAEVFIVSSMREGLNLTCHEFIIATTEKKSPLILSEFTGSSQLLDCSGKGAMLINPWDIKHFSEIFQKSLSMDPEEKLVRWKNCYDVVCSRDYRNWVKNCLLSINEAWNIDFERNARNVLKFDLSILQKFYKKTIGGKRLFMINLETASAVTSIGADLNASSATTTTLKNSDILSPSSLYHYLIDALLSDENNLVFICSYLKRSTLDTLFKRFPKFGLVAENGGYIKLVGTKKWISLVNEEESANWMPQVKQLVDAKVERLPGSKCEMGDCTIIFHPGKSFKEDRERSVDLMGDLISHVHDVFDENEGIHASLIWNTVVIQQNHLSARSLNFLINYYNNESVLDFKAKEVIDSTTSTPIKEKYNPLSNDKGNISGLFISGGTTLIDEPVYELANNLLDQHIVPNALTVAAFSNETKATSAKYGVSGRNELLSILRSYS